mgnify:CR=1
MLYTEFGRVIIRRRVVETVWRNYVALKPSYAVQAGGEKRYMSRT